MPGRTFYGTHASAKMLSRCFLVVWLVLSANGVLAQHGTGDEHPAQDLGPFNVREGSLVCVTGATGYVASVLLRALLDDPRQLRVRGTARASSLEKWSGHDLFKHQRIELREADLLEDGSYDFALAGCDVVHHTASPFLSASSVPKGGEEVMLWMPAVKGTHNVLKACVRAGVKHVVLTSSTAAVTPQRPDSARHTGLHFDESHWNVDSTMTEGSYRYSKVIAEQAAWTFARAQGAVVHETFPLDGDAQLLPFSHAIDGVSDTIKAQYQRHPFALTVVNPSFVIGPPVLARDEGVSVGFVAKMLRGGFKELDGGSCFGAVDVRDVAAAHVAAMDTPSAAGRRFVLSSPQCWTQLELAMAISRDEQFAQLPLPRTEKKQAGFRVRYEPARAVDILRNGKPLVTPDVAIVDMARQIMKLGLAEQRPDRHGAEL